MAEPNQGLSRTGLIIVAVFLMATTVLTFRLRTIDNCLFRVQSEAGHGKERCVVLEKATTPAERRLGLSGRSDMPPNRGMLFVFDALDEQCMWMKDMFFDLDMIWLDESGTISQIAPKVTPETYPNSYCGEGKYVVEVADGVAADAGLKVGDRLNLP